jgi:hypothetical protein
MGLGAIPAPGIGDGLTAVTWRTAVVLLCRGWLRALAGNAKAGIAVGVEDFYRPNSAAGLGVMPALTPAVETFGHCEQ